MKKFAAIVVGMLALSGCQARAGSYFSVSAAKTEVTFQLVFSGDGVEAVKASEDRIAALLAERTKAAVAVSHESDTTTFRVTTDIDTLVAQQGLTAVRGAAVTLTPEGLTRVQVDLGAPAELMNAITAGIASQADAGALSQAALGTTEVGATVSMGAITSAVFIDSSGTQTSVPHDGKVAEWYFDLGQLRTGSFVVVGSGTTPDDGRGINKAALLAAVAVIAATVAGVRASRRKR